MSGEAKKNKLRTIWLRNLWIAVISVYSRIFSQYRSDHARASAVQKDCFHPHHHLLHIVHSTF